MGEGIMVLLGLVGLTIGILLGMAEKIKDSHDSYKYKQSDSHAYNMSMIKSRNDKKYL